jgi:hypothetical protein
VLLPAASIYDEFAVAENIFKQVDAVLFGVLHQQQLRGCVSRTETKSSHHLSYASAASASQLYT